MSALTTSCTGSLGQSPTKAICFDVRGACWKVSLCWSFSFCSNSVGQSLASPLCHGYFLYPLLEKAVPALLGGLETWSATRTHKTQRSEERRVGKECRSR